MASAVGICCVWQYNETLKTDLQQHVRNGLKRMEILDYLERDYHQYNWSLRTLDRRLRYFDIKYSDVAVSVDDVRTAVATELDGPGVLLGYRAMQKKLRQVHMLNVPRELVHNVMYELDPEGLEGRRLGKKEKKKKGKFVSKGPDMVHSLDRHDKLMGYQNNTYPLAIYACIDTASRKLLWIKVWVSNSDPELPAKWYLQYLKETRRVASMMRLDKGTETGIMATMHAFLRRNHGHMDPTNTVLFGPSTSNQVSTKTERSNDCCCYFLTC